MKTLILFAVMLLLGHVDSAFAQHQSATPKTVCNCKGYSGPGGPCYAGPGGAAYDGPGGPAYRGPGGACYAGPGGPEYSGPGGNAYDGPGGPRYKGPGGPAYAGPGGPAYSGPGGACYDGPGGPCYSGPGGTGQQCPVVCTGTVSPHRVTKALDTTKSKSYSNQSSQVSNSNARGFVPVIARSKDENLDIVKNCRSAKKQRIAAFVANDWPEVAKRAEAYIALCKSVRDDEDISSAQSDIAISANEMNRPGEALDAAVACIATYYSNEGCHLQKVIALYRLHRSDDARTSLENAMGLIVHNRQLLEQKLSEETDPIEREDLELDLESNRASLRLANALNGATQ